MPEKNYDNSHILKIINHITDVNKNLQDILEKRNNSLEERLMDKINEFNTGLFEFKKEIIARNKEFEDDVRKKINTSIKDFKKKIDDVYNKMQNLTDHNNRINNNSTEIKELKDDFKILNNKLDELKTWCIKELPKEVKDDLIEETKTNFLWDKIKKYESLFFKLLSGFLGVITISYATGIHKYIFKLIKNIIGK